jgi:hypothetical protein
MTLPKGYVSSVSGQTSKAHPQGYYYHVAVSSDIPGAKSSIECDHRREDVISIIKDYNNFKEFECEQRTFRPADVTQILIYMTQENIEVLQSKVTKCANKNSEKWNNLVLRFGTPMNKEFSIRSPDPSLSDDFKFAKRRSMVNSIDNVYDFCKVMITLVSGFFAAYFALLKFLGVENALQQSIIPSFILLYPPILFVISIMVLVFGASTNP